MPVDCGIVRFYYLQKPLAEGKEREIRKSKSTTELQLKATELKCRH
jgi:hypothetical protein